jgi:cyclomaltodextrinase
MNWNNEAVFYHLYPLGATGQLHKVGETGSFNDITHWVDHIDEIGCNALYIGPIFYSDFHGYETIDYKLIDPRLGKNHEFTQFVNYAHSHGIRIVLDGVFNHTSRGFFAFSDILQHGRNSKYWNWYHVHEDHSKPDGISYESWEGHPELPKLNLNNKEVVSYLLEVVRYWKETFNIDGIRLDAADCLALEFIEELRKLSNSFDSNFWLVGELIHGDYRNWVVDHLLHSCTNYELYKGIWSSHKDQNFHEIAWTLKRQFADGGVYQGKSLYNFVDNHDVNRLRSNLEDNRHLYTSYIMLFAVPGIPSLYYGSEWGIEGKRTNSSDSMLRPQLDPRNFKGTEANLPAVIKKLSKININHPALRTGSYSEIQVESQYIVFERSLEGQKIIVFINASDEIQEYSGLTGSYYDLLNDEHIQGPVYCYPGWGRILIQN